MYLSRDFFLVFVSSVVSLCLFPHRAPAYFVCLLTHVCVCVYTVGILNHTHVYTCQGGEDMNRRGGGLSFVYHVKEFITRFIQGGLIQVM